MNSSEPSPQYKSIYNLIIERYKDIDKFIRNIQNDVKKLDDIHHKYIDSDGLESLNYSTYVDDIKYQLLSININQYQSMPIRSININ